MDDSDLVGRIAGMALTKLTNKSFASGVYFKITGINPSGSLNAVCTNPGLKTLCETFWPDDVRRKLRPEVIEEQLAPAEGQHLDYVAECYLTQREVDESDEFLRARLIALAMGRKAH